MQATQATASARRLYGRPLASFGSLFAGLALPPAQLAGRYRAEFVGPWWVRRLAPAALALSGLGGWYGKQFDGRGGAANLVRRGGGLRSILAMVAVSEPSALDGRPALNLHYAADAPLPWRWVVDELRSLDGAGATLLGMTRPSARRLSKLALPFVLHFED